MLGGHFESVVARAVSMEIFFGTPSKIVWYTNVFHHAQCVSLIIPVSLFSIRAPAKDSLDGIVVFIAWRNILYGLGVVVSVCGQTLPCHDNSVT